MRLIHHVNTSNGHVHDLVLSMGLFEESGFDYFNTNAHEWDLA